MRSSRASAWVLVLAGCSAAPMRHGDAVLAAEGMGRPLGRSAVTGTAETRPGPGTEAEGAAAGQVPRVRPEDVTIILDTGEATLGAYTVVLDFDPAVAVVESVRGGAEPSFRADPASHPPAFASGTVRLAGLQLGEGGPRGLVQVARVRFRAVSPGRTELRVRVEVAADPAGSPIAGARAVLSAAALEVR